MEKQIHGLSLFIDLLVVVGGALTVARGYEISDHVKDALLSSNLGIRDATIHIEPGSPIS